MYPHRVEYKDRVRGWTTIAYGKRVELLTQFKQHFTDYPRSYRLK